MCLYFWTSITIPICTCMFPLFPPLSPDLFLFSNLSLYQSLYASLSLSVLIYPYPCVYIYIYLSPCIFPPVSRSFTQPSLSVCLSHFRYLLVHPSMLPSLSVHICQCICGHSYFHMCVYLPICISISLCAHFPLCIHLCITVPIWLCA